MAEPFGNSRSQQLAAGQPSDVLALCWILASADRDRSLNLHLKGGRVPPSDGRFLAHAAAAPSASASDPAAPARSYRVGRGTTRSKALAEGVCGVCALRHFRLGDRALDRGRAGAERRAANSWSPWSPVLADGEAAAAFLFGHSRSAVAELFGNSRSQQLAAGQPSDVLALCWILASADRDRSLNLHLKGGRVPPSDGRFLAHTRHDPLGQRFRSGGAGAQLSGRPRHDPIESAGRGGLWRVCAPAFQAG